MSNIIDLVRERYAEDLESGLETMRVPIDHVARLVLLAEAQRTMILTLDRQVEESDQKRRAAERALEHEKQEVRRILCADAAIKNAVKLWDDIRTVHGKSKDEDDQVECLRRIRLSEKKAQLYCRVFNTLRVAIKTALHVQSTMNGTIAQCLRDALVTTERSLHQEHEELDASPAIAPDVSRFSAVANLFNAADELRLLVTMRLEGWRLSAKEEREIRSVAARLSVAQSDYRQAVRRENESDTTEPEGGDHV